LLDLDPHSTYKTESGSRCKIALKLEDFFIHNCKNGFLTFFLMKENYYFENVKPKKKVLKIKEKILEKFPK
jgi:hypothetical protein